MRAVLSLAMIAALPVILLASQLHRPTPHVAPPVMTPPAPSSRPVGPPPPLPGSKGKVGMNLSSSGSLTTELPFIDRMHYSGGWAVHWSKADPALLDAQGWPTRMPPDGSQYDAVIQLDPTPASYELTWSGKGNVVTDLINITDHGTRRITFTPKGVQIHVGIQRTDPADPIRDMHLVRTDQAALLRAGKIFNPVFLEKLRPFSPVRMMDWSCTNGSALAHWADRPKPAAFDWSCVPLEIEVALANELGADLWLTLPHLADDDFVRRTATYVRDHLDKRRHLQLEYSNEVWNTTFAQAKWAQAQADRLWGNGQPVQFGASMFYGYRAAQAAAIAREVYGDEAAVRLQPILADFTAWVGPEVKQAMLTGVQHAGKGSVGSLFKALAVTTYFGDALGIGIGNDADRPTTQAWASGGAAGMDKAFAQLEHGKLLKADGSLDDLRRIYPIHAAWAKTHGLALVAYEGGLSGYWFMADAPRQAIYVDFITRLKADPRFAGLYARMIGDFVAVGGSNVAIYTDTGKVSIFGPWGTIPDIYSTSPAYDRLVQIAGAR